MCTQSVFFKDNRQILKHQSNIVTDCIFSENESCLESGFKNASFKHFYVKVRIQNALFPNSYVKIQLKNYSFSHSYVKIQLKNYSISHSYVKKNTSICNEIFVSVSESGCVQRVNFFFLKNVFYYFFFLTGGFGHRMLLDWGP